MTVKELLIKNRTIRKYTQEEVSLDTLKDIVDHARLIGCANNMQSLRYVILHRPEDVADFQPFVHWAARLKGAGTPTAEELPVAFIVIVQTKPSGFSDIDAGMAAEVMMQAATEKGLGSCIFGSHSADKVGEYLGLQEGEKARLVMSFGHPAHQSHLVEAEDGDIAYYMDEKKDFYVPKRKLDDILEIRD